MKFSRSFGLDWVARGAVFATLSVPLILSIGAAPSALAQTPQPDKPARAEPAKQPTARVVKPAAVPKLEVGPTGFTVEPVPDWVLPLQPDASVQLPPAPLHMLLADRQTRVGPDGVVRYRHAVRQINQAAGLQQGAQIEIEFDPTYQKLALHSIEIVRDGQRINKLDPKSVKLLQRETQLERQIIDGRLTASIVLSDLRVGDRVEWAASLRGDNQVFGGRFVDLDWSSSSSGPMGLYRLRLLAPSERRIAQRVSEPSIAVVSTERNGWRETLFTRRGIAQFRYDETAPASAYASDQIDLSEFADWAQVAIWAESLFAKATQASPAIDARVADIRKLGGTKAEQVQAALDIVQQEVRYFGTEIGPDSHQPASADTVLRQRFGDCKDKVALLVTLLRGLEIKATPALVSVRFRDEVIDRLPSPLAFDHAISAVDIDGKTIWLDATRSKQTGPVAAREVSGMGHALLAQADAKALVVLPLAKDALRSETTDTFDFVILTKEGRLESVTTFYGDMAEWMREARAVMPPAEFEKVLTAEMLRAYPSFKRIGTTELEDLPGRNAMRVTLRFATGDAYWRYRDQRMLVGEFALLGLAAPLRLPDQNPRTQALRIALPGIYRHTVRFNFASDTFTQPSKSRFDEVNPHFELHLRYSGQHNEQAIEGELRQTASSVAAADWSAYRATLNKMWPRLGNMVTVPTISSALADSARTELTKLEAAVRKGDIKLLTREQSNARTQLILLNAQLDSGRLPDKVRAEVLVAKAAQLDHLGRADEALPLLDQALALDGANSEVFAAMAVNAFIRHDDAQAIARAQRSLELAPSEVTPRYSLAWAQYFSGDFAAAKAEFERIVQSSSEVERSYAPIWLYLSTRRLGGDGVAAVKGFEPTGSRPAWPYAALQWLLGRTDFDAALKATREADRPDLGRECELYLFAGQKALLDGDARQARSYFRKAIDTGVVEFTEYTMAMRELKKLDSR